MDHLSESVKHILDGVSILTVLGTLSSLLPSIAAVLSIIWTLVRLYESKTIQNWLKGIDDDD